MKEDFLHHIWLHKKINVNQLQTCNGEKLEIINFGNYLQTEGPDFFNAQIIIDNQKWAGNVEIHLKSSDWYVHSHQNDKNYENVILHVVWENDMAVYNASNSEIPVLELKNYVDSSLVENYLALSQSKSWINCENNIGNVDAFIFEKWKERLYIEKLESKLELVQTLLSESNNDWEYVLFVTLAKNFGLNTNSAIFLEMARKIPFSIIRKEKNSLETILFGTLNLLHPDFEDSYCKQLYIDWQYLKIKYNLSEIESQHVQFFKLRPDNFPTIRISQLAQLYSKHAFHFAKMNECVSVKELYAFFSASTSEYWKNHYNFDKISKPSQKNISKSFIDLLLLNTVLPFKFMYSQFYSHQNLDELVSILQEIKPEKNKIIDKFTSLNVISANAYDTQSLLYLKQNYCNKQKCLNCQIGVSILKENH